MRVERMRIKRRLALTLAAAMLLLAGCGDSERVIGGDVVNVTPGGSQPVRGIPGGAGVPAGGSRTRRDFQRICV